MRGEYFEDELINTALKKSKNYFVHNNFTNGLRVHDGLLKLNIFNKEVTYRLEFKINITNNVIGNLLILKNNSTYPLLLITRHVTGSMADKLKQENIEFIDTAGNVLINQKPVYIFVKGNKPTGDFVKSANKTVIKPTGLKVIFKFLSRPDFVNNTYREIAENAGVALGTVVCVMKELTEQGFLIKFKGKHRKLIKQEKLFEKWKNDYVEKLRPKLLLGKFTGEIDWRKKDSINHKYARWGGEVAAAKLTNLLKPQLITVYLNKKYLKEFVIENRLKKDTNGKIEILDHFWTNEKNCNTETVPPMLVYADLVGTGNQRNIEVAERIFKDYVEGYFRQS